MPRVKCPRCREVQHAEDSAERTWKCLYCGRVVRKKLGRSVRAKGRYYLEWISPFGWLLIGLLVLWLGCTGAALTAPEAARLLPVLGGGLVLVGNVWIGFIAYKDNHVFGMLCFFTCFFAYIYFFISPDETWRPGGLTMIGLLFLLSAGALAYLA